MPRTAPLDLAADVVELTSALIDVPSVSFHEQQLADLVETALREFPHLSVTRIGNSIVARTETGRSERVIVAGHLDTVPAAGNERAIYVPAGAEVPVAGLDAQQIAGEDLLYGLGSTDMKGGVAVALRCAREVTRPARDVTYVFYACEEVAASDNELGRIVAERPDLLSDAGMAVLMEPSDGEVEAGCQGTLRVNITTTGRRAHSARAWMGDNAAHKAGEILRLLADYQPEQVVIDGLTYREGLNAVKVAAGIAGNVIPDECTVTVNYRFAPSRTEQQALAHVQEVFSGFDVAVDDSAGGALPGLHQRAVADFVAATGSQVRAKYGWTDVARFSDLGMPALNFGPGDPSLAHTAEEHVAVAQLRSVEASMLAWLTAADEGPLPVLGGPGAGAS
ncbi:MAG: succinyl-diaminopimelate desuccinylase [Actinobacteria bacterium]|nr:succinyl-diaminopimelate desuccinylase [Actinomycetota bacterium]